MRNNLLLLGTLLYISSFESIAQQDVENISLWQQSHPSVSLISQERLSELTKEELSLLKDHIVYSGSIKLEDLVAFDQQKSGHNPAIQSETKDQAVKNWLGNHPEIEIIPYSVHSIVSAEKLEHLQNSHAMLLAGEFITISDIQNYHY